MAHKIILDVDLANGMGPARDVDDGLALALALTSPEVELLGCTTCAGNCRTSESTRQTLLFLEQAGRTDIPVAEGREEPLLADHRANFEYYDQRSAGFIGEETLWPETAQSWDLLHAGPTTEKSPLKAHDFIIEMVQRYPGEVTIIKEGSLTNLAMALLVEPSIAGKVKEVIRKAIARLGSLATTLTRRSCCVQTWVAASLLATLRQAVARAPLAAQRKCSSSLLRLRKKPQRSRPHSWYRPGSHMWSSRIIAMNTEFDPEATEVRFNPILIRFIPI